MIDLSGCGNLDIVKELAKRQTTLEKGGHHLDPTDELILLCRKLVKDLDHRAE